jgi:MbtH protein
MTSPFEDPDGTYLVLITGEGQHFLSPAFAEIPAGWTVAQPEDTRQACMDYINQHWTEIRPIPSKDAVTRAVTLAEAAGPETITVSARGHQLQIVPGEPGTAIHWEPGTNRPIVCNLRPSTYRWRVLDQLAAERGIAVRGPGRPPRPRGIPPQLWRSCWGSAARSTAMRTVRRGPPAGCVATDRRAVHPHSPVTHGRRIHHQTSGRRPGDPCGGDCAVSGEDHGGPGKYCAISTGPSATTGMGAIRSPAWDGSEPSSRTATLSPTNSACRLGFGEMVEHIA